jgi:hypothetical protein
MPSVIVCQTLKSRRSKRGYACDDDALMVSNSYGSFATMRPFGIARCCTAIEFVSFVSERAPRNAQARYHLQPFGEAAWSGSQWPCAEPSPPFGCGGIFDVTADQARETRFGLSRKAGGEKYNCSQCARFAVDLRVGPFVILLYLGSGERHEQRR